MTAELAIHPLRAAVARRQPTGTVVVHPDRGGQFRSRQFRAVLKANRLTGSMGRVSCAGDSAAMESFYALLQKNVLGRRQWRTRRELFYQIEHIYNRRRRQRGLGRLTPVESELTFTNPAAHDQPRRLCGLTTQSPSTKLRAVPLTRWVFSCREVRSVVAPVNHPTEVLGCSLIS